MQKITSHLMVMSRGAIILLLAFMCSFALNAQHCPPWPRQLDQAFFCYKPDAHKFDLEHDATIHNPVRFTFPLLPPNVTVTFDAGDGNGPSIITSGQIKTVTYPFPGQFSMTTIVAFPSPIPIIETITQTQNYVFQLNVNNDDANYADFLPHETWGNISGNTYTPPASSAYPPGSAWNSPVTTGGIVSVLYANPDHKFRKPFILVDGFDPVLEGADHFEVRNLDNTTLGYGSVRWDVLMTGRDESFDVDPTEPGVPHSPRFANFPSLVQGLRSQGYDIVLVDLADGGTYIQANGEFLIKVIEQINDEKIGTFPNALFGASMGGFIGRYALAKMEKDGKNHCTGLFGMLDTPNNGANIPMALQAFGWVIHATDTENKIEKQGPWLAAQTPAARQMLITNFGDEVQSGRISIENNIVLDPNWNNTYQNYVVFDELTNSDYSILREQLKNDLASFGWPQKPRKVAILDGMKNGTLPGIQGYGNGGKFYDAMGTLYPNIGNVFKLAMRSSNGGGPEEYVINGITSVCALWAAEIHDSGNLLLNMAQPSDFNPCLGKDLPHKYNSITVRSNSNLLHLDNAPGGYRTDLRGVHASLKSKIGEDAFYFNPVYHPIATFVPTWSALAMATPLNNTNLFVDLTTSEFAEENLPNAKVPNFDNFYAPTASLRHVELDGGMVAFILMELARLNASPQEGILTETYNYGKQYKEIPTTIVAATGRLNINNTGATGLIPSAPGPIANKPSFTTYLRDCGQRIDVEAGGQYNIGALDKSQHGITEVWDGGVVHIHSGGTLRITSNNSNLYIKHGATLIIDPGAIIILESAGSNIRIEGDLVVNGNFKFSGLGYFDFSTGNKLVFGNGYTIFNLNGAGKDKRFVRLSAPLLIDNAHRLNWSSGLIEVGANIHFSEGAGLNFTNMTLQGIGASTVIEALNSGAIMLERCDVSGLNLAINGENGEGCIISACTFTDYHDYQVFWQNAGSVQVLNSSFDGGGGSGGLFLYNVFTVLIKGSIFQGHGKPLTGIVDDIVLSDDFAAIELLDVAACLVDNSHFNNNRVGIRSKNELEPSNVYVYRSCTFSDNGAGVFVKGNETRGTVLSDCSLFDNNSAGAIWGRDITLMIDSWNSSAWTLDSDSPNRFIRNGFGAGSAKYIQICYELKAVGGSKLMRNNFWGAVGNPDPNPQDNILLLNASCTPFTPVVIPDLLPFATREPECSTEERPPSFAVVAPGTDCMLNTSLIPGRPVTVHEQFQLGTFLMRGESVEDGINALRPVAALWQPNMTTFSSNCQQYIQVAKAFVDGTDILGLPRPSNGRNQALTTSTLLIAPNPAQGSAMLYLPGEAYQLKVWDLQGSLVHQAAASGNYRLETASWSTGIYVVEAVAADGSRMSGKLVVQQ